MGEAVPVQPKQSVIRAYPQHAIAALEHRAHEFIGQSLGRAVRSKGSSPVAEQASAIGSRPDVAIPSGRQTEDAVLANRRRGIAVEEDKSGAIEPHQSAAGADPQVVIGSLRESLDRVLRQSVLRLPDTARVAVREAPGRSRTHCLRSYGNER